jgi:hypothetical protein
MTTDLPFPQPRHFRIPEELHPSRPPVMTHTNTPTCLPAPSSSRSTRSSKASTSHFCFWELRKWQELSAAAQVHRSDPCVATGKSTPIYFNLANSSTIPSLKNILLELDKSIETNIAPFLATVHLYIDSYDEGMTEGTKDKIIKCYFSELSPISRTRSSSPAAQCDQ